MPEAIVVLVEGALSSPWGLLALAAVAAVDGFVPLVPSESLVVTAGVFAARGDQSVLLVVGAAACPSWKGDQSPTSHASRRPGVPRSQSGQVSPPTSRAPRALHGPR